MKELQSQQGKKQILITIYIQSLIKPNPLEAVFIFLLRFMSDSYDRFIDKSAVFVRMFRVP